jgi:alpha-beta hydrolase superfamily lysophospholipase
MFMDHKFIKMKDGTELSVLIKEMGSPVWIIATHGIGEHMGRHKYIPELFGHDFNIFQYDLRGHGRSTGRRAWVSDFSLYMEDLKEIVRFLSEKYRMQKFVLFGHSMGALITANFMQNYVEEELYPTRIVLNAPPCGAAGILGQVIKILPLQFFKGACELPVSMPLSGLVDLAYLSHDPRVKDDYIHDNLNALKLESKLLFELMKTGVDTVSRPLRSKCPSFVSVGSEDRVIGKDDLVKYFSEVDKSFKLTVFDGAYHEIHNEIEKYRKSYFDYLKTVMNEVLFSS